MKFIKGRITRRHGILGIFLDVSPIKDKVERQQIAQALASTYLPVDGLVYGYDKNFQLQTSLE